MPLRADLIKEARVLKVVYTGRTTKQLSKAIYDAKRRQPFRTPPPLPVPNPKEEKKSTMEGTFGQEEKKSEERKTLNRPIIGPSMITFLHSPQYDKHILLLGERHSGQVQCIKGNDNAINASQYVKEGIETLRKWGPPEMVDVYVEAPFLDKNLKGRKIVTSSTSPEYNLGQFIIDFENCLQVDKSQCPWSPSRFHYIDVRKIYYQDVKQPEAKEEPKLHKDTILQYLHQGFDFERNDLRRAWVRLILARTMPKLIFDRLSLYEQIDAVRWPEVREALKRYLNDHVLIPFSRLRADVRQNQKKFLSKDPAIQTRAFADAKKAHHNSFIVGLMDTYTLARMMRCFKGAPDPRNIIFYGGSTHANNHLKFFLFYLKQGSFNVVADTKLRSVATDVRDPVPLFDVTRLEEEGARCISTWDLDWATIFPPFGREDEKKQPPCPREVEERPAKKTNTLDRNNLDVF